MSGAAAGTPVVPGGAATSARGLLHGAAAGASPGLRARFQGHAVGLPEPQDLQSLIEDDVHGDAGGSEAVEIALEA